MGQFVRRLSSHYSVGQRHIDTGIYRGRLRCIHTCHTFLSGDCLVTTGSRGYFSFLHAQQSPQGLHQETPFYPMIVTTALEEALNDAISSGRFIDTKIVLFSRRDSSGRICNPKSLYANSLVLKSVPYFRHREFSLYPSTVHDNHPS